MAEITINGVKFTNIPNKRLGTKIGTKLTQNGVPSDLEAYLASEQFYKLLCAVDIDWNGIEVAENVVVNDTADLINWIKSLEGQAGATGAQGPQGETGATGAQGPKGDTGAQGPKGDTGIQGPKGDTGIQGPKGDTGTFDASALDNYATKDFVTEKIADVVDGAPETFDTLKEIADWVSEHGEVTGIKGDTGEAGPKGDKGDTGETGPKGDKGDTGATGPKGDKGDTGATGPKGDTGTFDASALEDYATKSGVAELIGELGNKSEAKAAVYSAVENGTKLTAGETYYTSDAGEGEFKATGEEVANGTNYFVLTTPAADAVPYTNVMDIITENERVTSVALNSLRNQIENISLTPGATGAKGDTGETGPKGDKGDTGIQGPQGEKGDTGATGAQGPKGDTGEAGPKGDKGDTGATGAQGPKGDTGATGPKGDTGTFDASALADYATKSGVAELIGDMGNQTEAQGDTPAVPYTNVMDVIKDNEEVQAAALADLQAKYEALVTRIEALEGATGATGA